MWIWQVDEPLQPKDFAILYRTNAQSRALEEALRKKGIQYRVFGGTSFYQRKEIKDMVAYMRLLINQNDEEALLRTINYPARGIGQTTISKLLVAADQYQMSLFSLLENISMYAPNIGINAGTSNKLNDYVLMIKRFQVMLKSHDVYEVTMEMAKTTQLLNALKEDSTPEGVSRLENVQELLNSIQGYVEEQRQLDEGDSSLGGFLENIALATDADNEDEDDNKVNLMTVHLAKGLEFPVVFIAGLEENLFPSMMSVNTRAELEEERRLFYVALTRAEKVAYFTYSVSRFRWGKIIDCEPSRFLEEIDDSFLEWKNLNISARASNNSGLSADLFGDEPTPQQYQQREKSVARQNPRARLEPAQPRANFKPVNQTKSTGESSNSLGLQVGQVVVHDRFGRGVVRDLQGEPSDMKAIIHFDNAGEKKLLLNFAKLKVIR